MKKIIYTLVVVLSNIGGLKAQTEEAKAIRVGAKMPDYVFNDVRYYNKKTLDLKELRGQYVILDFWATTCSGCIKSFPKVNAIQQKFKDKVKIISVGSLDKSRKVEHVYEYLRQAHNLNLTVAYDSTNFRKIVPGGLPFLVWIDKLGIIKAVTFKMDMESVAKFVDNQPFDFYDTSYFTQNANDKKFDARKLFMIDGNGGAPSDTSFIFRSLISKWNKNMGLSMPAGIPKKPIKQRFQAIKVGLTHLFEYGTFGELGFPEDYYQKLIIETRDTANFTLNEAKEQGYFCYSLYMPSGTPIERQKKCIIDDLSNVFGYRVFTEVRKMPCYVLKVIDSSRLRNAKDSIAPLKTKWEKGLGGTLVDASPLFVAKVLAGGFSGLRLAVYDETGLKENLNLRISALTTDYNSIRTELKKYGLDLVRDNRDIKVLVVKDI